LGRMVLAIGSIKVRMLGGTLCEILVYRGWTAHDLKREVEEKLHVPVAQQLLFHGCHVLEDGDLDMAALGTLPAGDVGAYAPFELALLIRSPAVAHMLGAVRHNPWLLQFASEELRGNKEVVLQAVKHSYGQALEYATDELRGDREFVLQAVSHPTSGQALKYAADEIKGDRELVLQAVRHSACGRALEYATDELKSDRELILQAVSHSACGWALEYATEELRADRELVLHAVRHSYGQALKYATDELRGDSEFVLQAVSHSTCGRALKYAAYELKSDQGFVKSASDRMSKLRFAEGY